jgi:glyoxylase-like metal-dependent hydrolase (beta-lactamase superfamily II)
MYESLKRISELDPALKLYPGHDYGDVPVSSIAREREKNPYFARLGALPQFVGYRMRPRK